MCGENYPVAGPICTYGFFIFGLAVAWGNTSVFYGSGFVASAMIGRKLYRRDWIESLLVKAVSVYSCVMSLIDPPFSSRGRTGFVFVEFLSKKVKLGAQNGHKARNWWRKCFFFEFDNKDWLDSGEG